MRWLLEDLEEHLLIGSTLVEGSTFTEDEAREVLRGRTVTGHPIREHRELVNYRAAAEWFMREVRASPYMSVDVVRDLHRQLLFGLTDNAGCFKTQRNYTFRSNGSRHQYDPPDRVLPALTDWVTEYNHGAPAEPAPQSAKLYATFQQIHPFTDGNGRIGRLLIAYFLYWKHSMLFRFYARDKIEHLSALEASDDGKLGPLIDFFQARLIEASP
ncbi:MAG TPA: Fic family protein [Polyangiaceae bacterium]|jgi:Fic family protein